MLESLGKQFGNKAVVVAYGLIRKFSDIDLSQVERAAEALEVFFPLSIAEYYPAYIIKRMETCGEFVSKNKVEQFFRGNANE